MSHNAPHFQDFNYHSQLSLAPSTRNKPQQVLITSAAYLCMWMLRHECVFVGDPIQLDHLSGGFD